MRDRRVWQGARTRAVAVAVTAVLGAAVTAAAAAPAATAATTRPVIAGITASAGTPVWRAAEVGYAQKFRGAGVQGISCVSASRCAAVGTNGSAPAGLLLLTGAGHSWVKRTIRVPAGFSTAYSGLSAVACRGTSCQAVGAYQAKSAVLPLIVTGSGASWRAFRAPLPANAATGPVSGQQPSAYLYDIACATATACVAAGTYTDKSGFTQGLLLTGHGTSWKAAEAPLTLAGFNPNVTLLSAACATATRCVVAGYANDRNFNQFPALLTWSGKTWQRVTLRLPVRTAQGILSSVSCAPGGGCGAVGDLSAGATGAALLVTGSGTAWRTVTAPRDGFGQFIGAQGIACPATGHCVTAGPYQTASGVVPSALAVYSGYGTRWTVTKLAVPDRGTETEAGPVACASVTSCVIAGQYALPGKQADGEIFLLFRTGSAWRSARAPLPGNNVPVSIFAQGAISAPAPMTAACPTAAACAVGGTYYAKSVGMEGLILSGAA